MNRHAANNPAIRWHATFAVLWKVPSSPKMVPYQHLFSSFYYTIISLLLQLLLYQLCGFSNRHLYPAFAISGNRGDVIQGLHLQGVPLFHGVII